MEHAFITQVNDLYENAVDKRDADYLEKFLSEEVVFQIGNFPAVIGKEDVLAANRQFFTSIKAMRHEIDTVLVKDQIVACHGKVHYVRLNDTEYSAGFATFLTYDQDKIVDYKVFADISEL